MILSERLKNLREQKGVSLQKVADSLNVSKPHIWQLEKGEKCNPSLDLLKKLASYYSVSVAYLIGETDYINNHFCLFGVKYSTKSLKLDEEELIIKFMDLIATRVK